MTGKELARRRRALGLSQTAIAPFMEVTRPTIARWEAGTHKIPRPHFVDYVLRDLEDVVRRAEKGAAD